MSEEHYRAQQTLLVRGHDLAALQADLKTFSSKRQGSFTLGESCTGIQALLFRRPLWFHITFVSIDCQHQYGYLAAMRHFACSPMGVVCLLFLSSLLLARHCKQREQASLKEAGS
jgi:hypothetical protein